MDGGCRQNDNQGDYFSQPSEATEQASMHANARLMMNCPKNGKSAPNAGSFEVDATLHSR